MYSYYCMVYVLQNLLIVLACCEIYLSAILQLVTFD